MTMFARLVAQVSDIDLQFRQAGPLQWKAPECLENLLEIVLYLNIHFSFVSSWVANYMGTEIYLVVAE